MALEPSACPTKERATFEWANCSCLLSPEPIRCEPAESRKQLADPADWLTATPQSRCSARQQSACATNLRSFVPNKNQMAQPTFSPIPANRNCHTTRRDANAIISIANRYNKTQRNYANNTHKMNSRFEKLNANNLLIKPSGQIQIKTNARLLRAAETETERKMGSLSVSPAAETSSMKRKLLAVFYLYAILVVSLYLAYLVYHFYQQQHLIQTGESSRLEARSIPVEPTASEANRAQQELETKIRLLERYIDVIALDLQETNKRMREREKCDCSLSCTFNGTRYDDRSSWQHHCDTCTCQSGRISCVPQKCPTMSCDDLVLVAGKCCPSCMKKCKHNNKLLRHGQKFKPLDSSKKECRCQDGLIKCEQQAFAQIRPLALLANKSAPNSTAKVKQ